MVLHLKCNTFLNAAKVIKTYMFDENKIERYFAKCLCVSS